MKNILLPTDFSENSWNAIKYAIQFFKHEQCTFHLFNAYTPPVYDFTYMLLDSPAQFGIQDPVREISKEQLSQLHVRILNELGINTNHKFETIARFDTLISGIHELIEERQIDLIIMGTKGATGAKTILFGSNTVQVFKDVKCPIMAIPSGFEYVTPHDILFPTDFNRAYTNKEIDMLTNISRMFDAHIYIMHINLKDDLSKVQQNNMRDLQNHFTNVEHTFHWMDKTDTKSEEINEFVDEFKINLLAMVNYKHSFIESIIKEPVIKKIGFKPTVPFLVIPE